MRTAFAVLAASVALAACGASPGASEQKTSSAGALVSQRPLGNLDSSLTKATSSATYIRYQSTSPEAKPIEVSGAVFLPAGTAPSGGWPLVAFAHGTSGVVSACAPTNSPVLFGSAPIVAELLAAGRAVAMTNYQGLGGPGAAPYLDTPSSGYDVLDSARAARSLGLPLSPDTVLVGLSQGGRAAESAAETAKAYAPDLAIRGVVLLSPALQIDFAKALKAKTLKRPDQYLLMPYLAEAVRFGDPSFSDDKIMRGPLLAAAPTLVGKCTGQMNAADIAIAGKADSAAVFADEAAERAMAAFESRSNLPKTATDLPTYILRGGADVLVNTAWTTEAVAKMCALGTQVHDVVIPGGHEAPNAQPATWTGWISDLFQGTPIPTTCQK